MILSQPNQSEVNCSHTRVADDGNGFIGVIEGELPAVSSEGPSRQVGDIVWAKNSGATGHVGVWMDGNDDEATGLRLELR